MFPRLAALLLLASAFRGCVAYEYEHEFWVRVDGSGTVNVTGRPGLWVAFKGLGRPEDPDGTATRETARALFERSGLEVKRVTLTRRSGRPYLFLSADFKDINALSGTPAFPDLRIALRHEGQRLRLDGTWERPAAAAAAPERDREGLMAVRFHLPSKVYEHRNAVEGVERGNIVGWRQDVTAGLTGGKLEVGALIDERSILLSTVTLFAAAIVIALALLVLVLYAVVRRGRKALDADASRT
jgi:hypothetical protein